MFCCGSKKKKTKKSAKQEEPSTSSDQQSFKKDEESQVTKQQVQTQVPKTQPTITTDKEMLRQIQNINDLRQKGQYQQSVKCEHDYITALINKENTPQEFALEYKWAVNYTNHLKGKQTQIPAINNQILLENSNRIRRDLQPDKDYVILNQPAWNFVLQLYGGGPEVRIQTNETTKPPQPTTQQQPPPKPPMPSQSSVQTNQYSRFVGKNQMAQTVSTISTAKSVDRQSSQIQQSTQRNESAQNSRIVNSGFEKRPSSSISGSVLPIVGLRNPRYYCYMNSALQVLLSIDSFNEGIISIQSRSGFKFLQAFQELLRTIKRSQSFQAIAAQSIWEICSGKFQFNQQQDSHEFLLFLLGKMQEELVGKYKNKQEFKSAQEAWNDYTSKNEDIIDQLFAGQSTSQSYCKSCNEVCEGYDPVWDLSLPICKSYTGVDLMECLQSYFREEVINDTWKCDKCKKTNKSVKRKMFISQTPKYLIIQFKRFTTFPSSKKLNDEINYPEKLDMAPFCNKGLQTKYRLKALITHMGSINGGHYKAYAERYNNWYLFDDETVSKVSGKQLNEKQAYVLVYEKV